MSSNTSSEELKWRIDVLWALIAGGGMTAAQARSCALKAFALEAHLVTVRWAERHR